MLNSAADCEEVCNINKKVWRSAIFNDYKWEWDYDIRQYYSTDFNTAILKNYNSSEGISKVSIIKSDKEDVDDLMDQLKNPPNGCKDVYEAVKDLYGEYSAFVDLATDPTGSLIFSDLDDGLINYYNRMTNAIPSKK